MALAAWLAVAAFGASCHSAPVPASTRIIMATTSSVFGDLIANVAGDLAEVISLVRTNGDVRTVEPKPSDMRALAGAQLVIMNGLGLNDWMADAMTTA